MSKNKKIKTEKVDDNDSDYDSDNGVKLASEDECLGAILDTIPALKQEIKLLRKSVKEVKKENRKLKSKNTRFTKKSDKQEEKIKKLKDDFKEMKKDYKKSLNEELKATNRYEREKRKTINNREKMDDKIKSLKHELKLKDMRLKIVTDGHEKLTKYIRKTMDKMTHNQVKFFSRIELELEENCCSDEYIEAKMDKKLNKSKSKRTKKSYTLFKAFDDASHTGPWNYEKGFLSYGEVMERAEELKDSYDKNGKHCQVLMIYDDSNVDGNDIWQWNYDPDDESDSEGDDDHHVVLDGSALWNSGKVIYSAD